MKGFRKGKVPMALLKKQFGPRLMGEAMQEEIDGAVKTKMDAAGDRPAMQPSVKMTNENWKEGDDVHVEVAYERLPDVPSVDLSGVAITRMVVKADDAAVTEALDNLAGTSKSYDDRKKGSKAKDGDQVVIDFVGRVDGEAFEGGSATDYPLVLGSNSFIPGFEDQLVGVKAGEEKEVNVHFPANYQAANLAGKAAVFTCTVKAVKEPKAAEVNDELAKKFGAEDLAGLKTQITESLEREYVGRRPRGDERALLDQLDALVAFDLPSNLVEAEAAQIAHQLWHEEHPKSRGTTMMRSSPRRASEAAVRRVKLGLLLADIGQKAEVKVTDSELTQAVLNEARRYRGQERQFFEYVQKNAGRAQQIQAPISKRRSSTIS